MHPSMKSCLFSFMRASKLSTTMTTGGQFRHDLLRLVLGLSMIKVAAVITQRITDGNSDFLCFPNIQEHDSNIASSVEQQD